MFECLQRNHLHYKHNQFRHLYHWLNLYYSERNAYLHRIAQCYNRLHHYRYILPDHTTRHREHPPHHKWKVPLNCNHHPNHANGYTDHPKDHHHNLLLTEMPLLSQPTSIKISFFSYLIPFFFSKHVKPFTFQSSQTNVHTVCYPFLLMHEYQLR